jgi:hypothetical protein
MQLMIPLWSSGSTPVVLLPLWSQRRLEKCEIADALIETRFVTRNRLCAANFTLTMPSPASEMTG